jgi:hypothetical protein
VILLQGADSLGDAFSEKEIAGQSVILSTHYTQVCSFQKHIITKRDARHLIHLHSHEHCFSGPFDSIIALWGEEPNRLL